MECRAHGCGVKIVQNGGGYEHRFQKRDGEWQFDEERGTRINYALEVDGCGGWAFDFVKEAKGWW